MGLKGTVQGARGIGTQVGWPLPQPHSCLCPGRGPFLQEDPTAPLGRGALSSPQISLTDASSGSGVGMGGHIAPKRVEIESVEGKSTSLCIEHARVRTHTHRP